MGVRPRFERTGNAERRIRSIRFDDVCLCDVTGDGRNMDFRDSQEASVNMATDAIEAMGEAVAGEAVAAPIADTSSKHGGAKRKLNTRGDSKAVKQQLYPVE